MSFYWISDRLGNVVSPNGDVLILEEYQEYVLNARDHSYLVFLDLRSESITSGRSSFHTGFRVGSTFLRVGFPTGEIVVTVQIVPKLEKMSDPLWSQLILEMWEWLPGSVIGVSGARSGGMGYDGVQQSILIEAVIALIDTFGRYLDAIIEHPKMQTTLALGEIDIRRARNADVELMHWLTKHPVTGSYGAATYVPYRAPFDDFAHPVNRYIAWMARRVVEVIRQGASKLTSFKERKFEHDYEWCQARAEALSVGAARLKRKLDTSFLNDLEPVLESDAATMVIANDPIYAGCAQLGRLLLDPRWHIDSSNYEGASLRSSYSIYEIWCFLRICREFEAIGWEGELKDSHLLLDLSSDGRGATWKGARGDASVEIEFNAVFLSDPTGSKYERWSISKTRRPDILISIQSETGRKCLLLDAKYRVKKENVSDAMESAHIYRDSLRMRDMPGENLPCFLMCPAIVEDAKPFFEYGYLDAHRVGALLLHPGVEFGAVARFVELVILTR